MTKMFMLLLAALCAVGSIRGAENAASAEVETSSNFMMRRRYDDFRRRRYNRYNRYNRNDDDDDDDDDERDYGRGYRRNYRRDYDDDKMSAVSFSSESVAEPAVASTSSEAYIGNDYNRRRDSRSRRDSRGGWGRRMRDGRQRRYQNRDSRRYRNRDSRRNNRRSRSYRRNDDDRRRSRSDRDYDRDDKV